MSKLKVQNKIRFQMQVKWNIFRVGNRLNNDFIDNFSLKSKKKKKSIFKRSELILVYLKSISFFSTRSEIFFSILNFQIDLNISKSIWIFSFDLNIFKSIRIFSFDLNIFWSIRFFNSIRIDFLKKKYLIRFLFYF